MAVYATYRHIELDKIGYGKKRVLKPPGGGSSDIFGPTDSAEQSPRRRATNHLQSSVFAASDMTEPPVTPRNKPGNDSHNRLFGPVEAQPQSTTKNRLKSNIPFGEINGEENKSAIANDITVENGHLEVLSTPKVRRNPVTGDGMSSSDCVLRRTVKRRDGNPVTGEGYSATNGEKDGSSPPATTAASAEIRRNRVPPGGYSSGLW